jgi:hypothetical protein
VSSLFGPKFLCYSFGQFQKRLSPVETVFWSRQRSVEAAFPLSRLAHGGCYESTARLS